MNVHTEANESVGNVRVDLGAHTLLPVELSRSNWSICISQYLGYPEGLMHVAIYDNKINTTN